MPNAPIGPNDPENQVDELLEAFNHIIDRFGLNQPHQNHNLERLLEALQERLEELRQSEQSEVH
jgi:hypothetical protein